MLTDKIIIAEYTSPCGTLILGSYDDRLCLCDWQQEKHHKRVIERLKRHLHAKYEYGTSAIIECAVGQLNEYFAGTRNVFDIPLMFAGTDFQKTVWNTLSKVPYGDTISYGELAELAGRRTSIRAVANAIGANAISLFVPCHRVIGSNGSLTGYAGGLTAKQFLLTLEHRHNS